MAFLDSIARLQPGVLNTQESHQFDSFNNSIEGLLDCPHYTRPELWEGLTVPDDLMSGHHEKIQLCRKQQSLAITERQRPDLLERLKRR